MSGKPSIHMRMTYHLPRWQGGDVEIARCQKGAIGWSADGQRTFKLADIGVTCPRCLGIMHHGVRPNGSAKRQDRAA